MRAVCLSLRVGLFALFIFSCSPARSIRNSARKIVADSTLHNAHVGISIYEPATDKYWYDYQGDHYFVPASNTKIPTCYAAMKYLEDSLVGLLYKETVGGLTIIGTGDPSFLHPDFPSQPVFDFLRNNKADSLNLFEPLSKKNGYKLLPRYGKGWSWDDYNDDYMAERNFFPLYGNVMRIRIQQGKPRVMPSSFSRYVLPDYHHLGDTSFQAQRERSSNFVVLKNGDRAYQEIPFITGMFDLEMTEARLLSDTLKKPVTCQIASVAEMNGLKSIASQPTDSVLSYLMHRSDNFFAEQCLQMVSNQLLGYMSDDITDSLLLREFKQLPQLPRWADGSGLSRYNLFSPQDFVHILNKMQMEFGMERIKKIFPTGGEGTLRNYYIRDSGFIYAKTGTLSGVVALSGFLYTRKGKLLVFSVLVNNHTGSATSIRRSVETFLGKISVER